MNAPAVFQRLMRRVLMNVDSEKEFVSIYLDDVLVFSKTSEEHMVHLHQVLGRFRPESIMLFKLPIMLLSISSKIYLLCSILCSIMPNYAPLIVRNYLFSVTPTCNYSNLLFI